MKVCINGFLVIMIFLAPVINVNAQFYYTDILSGKDLVAEMSKLKDQKIRTIKVKSFEDDGSESEGFFLEKKISRDYLTVETESRSYMSTASLLTNYFNKGGLLQKTTDSSAISVRSSVYSYNAAGQINSILSTIRSTDDDMVNEIIEEHIYLYNEKGILYKMNKVKNTSDTTVILFSADEKNNVAIEKDTKSGSKYYYYYDNKGRLTDITHSNDFQQNIYPDYLFEYNSAGLVTQMINTEEGANKYYYIWKYTYADGLRIKEKCFSKEKRLMGSVEYEYK
jgi:hypothetical protein